VQFLASSRRTGYACEKGRKLALAAAVALCLAASVPARAAQPEPSPAAAGEAHHEEESHGGGIVDVLARLVNFGVLAGTLVYFLRSPIATYLASRHEQIRSDLVTAAEMKRAAATQIEQIERQMKALPAELDALRTQGADEIAAEEERIRTAAAAERDRLLDQARRDIDLQVRVAERDLTTHAAELAIGVATDRIKRTITDDDRQRLVDRYVEQLHP
jgi:F-type H+-transporting ATPase subunit b